MILGHFDQQVIQSSYGPYYGFNFGYLFATSVCLICFSHLVNLIYWILRRSADPKVGELHNKQGILNSDRFLYLDPPEQRRQRSTGESSSLQSPSLPSRLSTHPPLLPDHRAHHLRGGERPHRVRGVGGDGDEEVRAHGHVQRHQAHR